jgi:hypothetical protein
MKELLRISLSFLFGLAAFVGVFLGVGELIELIIKGSSGDIKVILRVVLWIVGIGFTLFMGILIGWLVGNIVNILLGGKA